jgi:hypothetical protein
VAVGYNAFLAALAEQASLKADPIDLQDRAEHLSALFVGPASCVGVVLDDTVQNVSGGLDLKDAEAILADLAADLIGAIQRATDQMADDIVGRVE